MRPQLAALDGREFDVVIVGAGVNGASAAQSLSAAGYSVLLVDKGDFGSGSSSRSSRLLHCGLRYLAPGSSTWEFVRHPDRLATALRMAKQAMESRSQFVVTARERTRSMKFCFPIYRGGPYKTWQVDLAFRLLNFLGPKEVPLDYRRLAPQTVRDTPLLRWLRDQDRLTSVAMFREYQFEWPERICVDTALDAERMGAVLRNYTAATRLERSGDAGWKVTLRDVRESASQATVSGKIVLNMAGIWIDEVNARASGARPKRKITGTKGVHIMIRLPPECQDYGIATLNRLNEGFYCVPWRGLHYFGPTETLYEGDRDDIRPLEEEISFLLDEANYLLPALKLTRDDVLFAWAGVRPLTYDPALLPQGKRSRELHDLAADGMPDVLALTAGPIMTHRSAGVEVTQAVQRRFKPSGTPQGLSYGARLYPDNQNAPPLLEDDTTVKLSDLRFAAQHEHATNLVDLMFRRTGAGWTATMGAQVAERAAEAVADIMGWDAARVAQEAQRYRDYLARFHLPKALG
jgi:glycerol-3-phosphate dehydrogenase